MRKIKFNPAIADKKTNGSYPIVLGNGAVNIFHTKKQALAFLVEAAQFLENQFIFINQIAASLYHIFTDFWFYTDVEAGRGSVGYFQHEKKIRQSFDYFHETRHDIFTMQFRKSAPTLTFAYTGKIIKELKLIATQLLLIIHNKSLGAHIATLTSLQFQLNEIDHRINNFSFDTAAAIDTTVHRLPIIDLFNTKTA